MGRKNNKVINENRITKTKPNRSQEKFNEVKKLTGINKDKTRKFKSNKCNGKKYDKETLMKALTEIENGQTLRQAATFFGIPKSTLHAKFSCRVPIDCARGAPTILSPKEELEIVEWIIYCAERGFPVTKSYILDCVQKFIIADKRKNTFKDNRPGKHWYNGFMKRHDNLRLRIAQNLTSSRASVTEEDLKNWFSIVKSYLEKKDLINVKPERIFNLDESSFNLVPKDTTVITQKGAKSVYQIVGGNEKACMTVLVTASASGQILPPMVLFDLKTIPKKSLVNSIPKGWGIGHSDRGWMTSETFYSYIVNIFYKWLIDNEVEFPIILYVDGHASHLTLPLINFCKEFQIELIALYPNATHIIQPLDVALFHPLKEAYKSTLKTWRIDNNIVAVKKSMFAVILKKALDSIDVTETIKNGFRACGLYPFELSAVNYDILNKKKKKNHRSSSDQLESLSSTMNNKLLHLLNLFEQNVISAETLQIFKHNEFEELWKGEDSQKGRFEYWRALKKFCVTDSQLSSVISELEDEKSFEDLIENNEVINKSEDAIQDQSQTYAVETAEIINEQKYEEIIQQPFTLEPLLQEHCQQQYQIVQQQINQQMQLGEVNNVSLHNQSIQNENPNFPSCPIVIPAEAQLSEVLIEDLPNLIQSQRKLYFYASPFQLNLSKKSSVFLTHI